MQNPSENRNQEEVIARFLGRAPGALPPVLIFAAHPGDEIVGAGGQLHRYAAREQGIPEELLVVHATHEGAGRWLAAFQAGGLHEGCRVTLGFEGAEWPSRLASVVRILLAHLWEFRPGIILTHAYEGDDPACDACAFAAQMAGSLMFGEIGPPPVRLEMTTSHAGDKTLLFPPASGSECAERIALLGEAARLRKALMLAQLPAFAHLALGTSGGERFRIAPDYDFSQPPSSGRIGLKWFDQVREAERELRSR